MRGLSEDALEAVKPSAEGGEWRSASEFLREDFAGITLSLRWCDAFLILGGRAGGDCAASSSMAFFSENDAVFLGGVGGAGGT